MLTDAAGRPRVRRRPPGRWAGHGAPRPGRATGPPHIALIAEVRRAARLGHACGHNLIAASAIGAALWRAPPATAQAITVQVLGTPAEEGGGGKIGHAWTPAEFDGLDARA